jgi:putative Holliday junction resolvase
MDFYNTENLIRSPLIALDLGRKRVGVAISDSLSISITRLAPLPRTNWKQLLLDVGDLVRRFDVQTVVIGFPLRLNGSEGDAAEEARLHAMKFARSLNLPVYLQDERLSSVAAAENLRLEGCNHKEISRLVDSEAAAIILRDFLAAGEERRLVSPAQANL